MEKSFSGNSSSAPMRRDLIGHGADPLEFAFWNVHGDIVRDNMARFAAEVGEAVVCCEISGDYEEALNARFSRGEGPDVFYAQRAEASLWGAEGFIEPLDDVRLSPLLKRMEPRMVRGARDAKGRLLGLTYYNGGPFALYAHARFAGAADLQFALWDQVLDFLRRAKRDGIADHPFLPRWHSSQTGLVWSLLCHLASEGVIDLNEAAFPTFEGVLQFFSALVEERLVPPESLDDRGDSPALQRWISGKHLLNFTTDYLAMDAARAAGGPVNIMLDLPGKSGTTLMPGHALLCLRAGNDAPRLARAQRLLAYFGGPAVDGTLAVHERWLRECLFGVPYGEIERLPEMGEAMMAAFAQPHACRSVDRLLAARASAVMSPPTQHPAMLEWTRFADRLIRDELLRHNRLSCAAAATQLLLEWARLTHA